MKTALKLLFLTMVCTIGMSTANKSKAQSVDDCTWNVREDDRLAKLKFYGFKSIAFRELRVGGENTPRCIQEYSYDAVKLKYGVEQDGLWDFRIRYSKVNGKLVVISVYAYTQIRGKWNKFVYL